jgi:hypothetical protein
MMLTDIVTDLTKAGEWELWAEANAGEAGVKPRSGGRSPKLPLLYAGLTR